MTYDLPTFVNRATVLTAISLAAMPFLLPSITLCTEIVVLAAGALSAAFLLGNVGLLSFGQGLYFGVGAYTSGLLLSKLHVPFILSIPLGIIAGAAISLPIGWMIVRRRGVYFVMLTFAFAQMGFFAMHAFGDVTGGENGLSNVPKLIISEDKTTNATLIYSLLASLFFVGFLFVQRLRASPFGTVLAAVRSNEARAEALGYNTRLYKLSAFAIAGGIAGLAGAMNTVFLGFVPPSAIDLETSERLLVIALIGGTGSPAGALLGAAFYAVLADLLGHLWSRWLMVVAALLVIIVLFLKDGMVGIPNQIYAFRRRGGEHGKVA